MYRLAITRDFIAQHFLIGGDWGAENTRHSHHYRLQLRLRGESLDRHGYLCDIVELERVLDEVLGGYRDRTLNELAPFAGINPSLERFAKILYDELLARLELRDVTIAVRLWENEHDWAAYGAD
ncbi:MAG: 6-carboxytetrahydropterin synthase [Limnobacter sp.]|nr:6-carboxytetrahydropterin synthase [Limnobacter sp.]